MAIEKNEKVSLRQLFERADCRAVAWHVTGRYYIFQRVDDFVIRHLNEMSNEKDETLLRVEDGIYILKNDHGINFEDGAPATIPEIKKNLKEYEEEKKNNE